MPVCTPVSARLRDSKTRSGEKFGELVRNRGTSRQAVRGHRTALPAPSPTDSDSQLPYAVDRHPSVRWLAHAVLRLDPSYFRSRRCVHCLQAVDVSVNVCLEFADFVYWPLRHNREVPRILWQYVYPQAIERATQPLNLFDGLVQLGVGGNHIRMLRGNRHNSPTPRVSSTTRAQCSIRRHSRSYCVAARRETRLRPPAITPP